MTQTHNWLPEHLLDPSINSALSSLDDIKKFQRAVQADLENFVDLIKLMSQLDPEDRITPNQVLQHLFITMQHLMGFRLQAQIKMRHTVSV